MKPVLQALLLADRVYTDKDSNKKIIAGVFQNLFIKTKETVEKEKEQNNGMMPVSPQGYNAGSPFAYISLVDVLGKHRFILRYVDLADDSVLFEFNLDVDWKDPLAPVETGVPIPTLPTKVGTYALELVWEGEPLGSYRISVRESPCSASNDDAEEDIE